MSSDTDPVPRIEYTDNQENQNNNGRIEIETTRIRRKWTNKAFKYPLPRCKRLDINFSFQKILNISKTSRASGSD